MIDVISAAMVKRLSDRLIADRVAAGQVALVEAVYSQTEYVAVPESQMVTPSLAVVYSGYTPDGTPGTSKKVAHIQRVGFSFLVVINVASAFNSNEADGVNEEVSPVFNAVLEALLGFRPGKGIEPMSLEPAPGSAFDAGFMYYPVSFTTAATYVGTP